MNKTKLSFVVLTTLITVLTTAGGVFLMFYMLIDVLEIPTKLSHNPSTAIQFLLLIPIPFISGGLWGGGIAYLMGKPGWPAAKKMSGYWFGTFVIAVLAIDFTQLLNGVFAGYSAYIPHILHYWFTFVFVLGVGIFVRLNVQKLLATLGLDVLVDSAGIQSGTAAAAAFLITSLLLLFGPGWEVAGPLAGQKYSMISITHVCNLAAATAGGLVIGLKIFD